MSLFVGKEVVVVGTSRADINGSVGVATHFVADTGRIAVKLTSGKSSGKSIAFKPENLCLHEEEKCEELIAMNGKPMEMHIFTQKVGFRCQPQHLFTALTDQKMVSGYTQAPCESDVKVGGKFSFFAGNVAGSYVELVPPSKIVMKWRNKDWHAGYYSKVTIELEEPAGSSAVTVLSLTHEGIPDADKFGNSRQLENVEAGWENYFWERIQKMVGYHKVDKADW